MIIENEYKIVMHELIYLKTDVLVAAILYLVIEKAINEQKSFHLVSTDYE